LGEGLVVSGRAPIDDLPEAIELPGKRFALGVQWHPEADETSRLIAALVEHAG
jgi:putative glutamine amidotransferase